MPDAEGVTLEPHSSCVCPTPIKGLGWVGGWVGVSPPTPPLGGGVGHLSVCGYAKILGGWVPELTPPPLGWLSKTLLHPCFEDAGYCSMVHLPPSHPPPPPLGRFSIRPIQSN